MGLQQNLEEFDIRIKKVKYYSVDTSRAVFDAIVLVYRPRKKVWDEINQKVTCIGHFYGLLENDHLHVQAEEIDDPIYGREYQVYSSERVEPGTEFELRRFLTSINRVGAKHADSIISQLGLNAISKIVQQPEVLNKIPLSVSARKNIFVSVVENKEYEQLLIFLQMYDVTPRYATAIFKKYGAHSIEKIRDNPFSLYLDDVVEFPVADRLHKALGGDIRHAYRIHAALLACVRDESYTKGNVAVNKQELPALVSSFLCRGCKDEENFILSNQEFTAALDSLVQQEQFVIDGSVSLQPSVYLAKNYVAEKRTAERLRDILSAPKTFYVSNSAIEDAIQNVQSETGFQLAEEQAQAIRVAISSPLSIITGGPGTGKSQTLTMMVKVIEKIKEDAVLKLCAPTGKAAMRIQELTGMNASTIHRLIGFPHATLDDDALSCDFVIADEFSMCDIQICSYLLKCISRKARLIIVGDHEQLPSVGPGLVLRDLINSGYITVTKLKTVFRQNSNSRIINNAHAIISATAAYAPALDFSTKPGEDFYFIHADTQGKILRMIEKSIQRLISEGFLQEQIEVLSPLRGGLIGVENLNQVLQSLLNSGQRGYLLDHGVELRCKDKVIQTKNDYDLSVFNGETGVVKAISYTTDNAILVTFPNREVWYNADQAENLDLAYSITTHRSQGSEFQVVIIPVHETILFNMNKNLLYTAITRAKRRVVIIGSEASFYAGVQRAITAERRSNLIQRLESAI